MAEDVQISAAIVTMSDSRSIEDDLSGRRLGALLEAHGAMVVTHTLVSDDLETIEKELKSLTQKDDINLIITTGGTGLGPRDNTPEATKNVIDREVPGIAETMRRETAGQTIYSMLSRGIAGTRNGKLIINLPGSPKGVAECFHVIAPILNHAIRMVSGDTKH